jgi:hypothetical protein
MNTLIEKVINEEEIQTNNSFVFEEKNLSKYIIDLSLNQDIRIKALEMYFDRDSESTIEIISRITGMYQFSGTKIIQNFLYYICMFEVKLSSFLKYECAKSLLSFFEFEEEIFKDDETDMIEIKTDSNNLIKQRNNDRKVLGYEALNNVCKIINDDISFPTPCRLESIYMLMEYEKYKDTADLYFRKVINDITLDCDFRYKTILSLEKQRGVSSVDNKLLNLKFYITNACLDFLKNEENKIMYRILSAQYLLQNCDNQDNIKDNIYNILYNFSTNEGVEYNLRADAADTLLTFGSEDFKTKARDVITILGQIDGVVKNIYDNAQNVHTKEVEKSVGEILEILLAYKTIIIDDEPIDFDYVTSQINNLNEDLNEDIKQKIKISLNRIEMDRTLYSKQSSNLSNILVKLWSYIHDNEFKNDMSQRLLQELEDMSGTCSSGFVTRLVNTLSGFGNLSVKISFDDQLISNFTGRLNMYARKLGDADCPFRNDKLYDVIELYIYKNNLLQTYVNKNTRTMKDVIKEFLKIDKEEKINNVLEDFSMEVINEMTLDPNKFNDRRNFLMFFRVYMLRIREELYEEFKDFMTDTEFDLCIRKAISTYEGLTTVV